MNNLKRIAVILLAVIMCASATIVASATESTFSPKVDIITCYTDKGEAIEASVITTQACGAIKATLTYSGNVTFNKDAEGAVTFIEKEGVSAADLFKTETNSITFVVASDNDAGDKSWAKFKFNLSEGATGDVTFEVTTAEVCDPAGTDLEKEGITLEGKKVTVTATTVKTLGAQYRFANDGYSTNKKAALRFGSKLTRDNENMVDIDGTKYLAVSCGFIGGFDTVIAAQNENTPEMSKLELTLNETDGSVTSKYNYAVPVPATACYEVADDYLIHTLAISGFTENDAYADEKFSARPYVIYKKDGKYAVAYGETITKTYKEVKMAAELK